MASACWRVRTVLSGLRRLSNHTTSALAFALVGMVRVTLRRSSATCHNLLTTLSSSLRMMLVVTAPIPTPAYSFTDISGQNQCVGHETTRSGDLDLRLVPMVRHEVLELPRTPPNHESKRQLEQSPQDTLREHMEMRLTRLWPSHDTRNTA